MKTQYILAIDFLDDSIIDAVRQLRQQAKFENLGIVLLTTRPEHHQKIVSKTKQLPIAIVACNFKDDAEIEKALSPYLENLVAVNCRSDKRIQYLRKIITHLPKKVLVASAESLAASTNKRLMRAAFVAKFPEITPQFIEVYDNTEATVRSVEDNLQYPVIVKPANLVSSLLIQACYDHEDLQQVLTRVFEQIHRIYQQEGHQDAPQVIAEEYMEGRLYSIDAYVMAADKIFYCPPVQYIPAKQLGIDDFFVYKRFMPTELTETEVRAANEVVKKALIAIDLTYSSAHVELVLTEHGWKIIELGPRIGRFRNKMYGLIYGIDHSLNDIKIHLGIKPDIPSEPLGYCAGYSIYPNHEGILRAIRGINSLQAYPEVNGLKIFAKTGDDCSFAKHGGHSLAEFIVASSDKRRYDEIVRFIENEVHADIDQA